VLLASSYQLFSSISDNALFFCVLLFLLRIDKLRKVRILLDRSLIGVRQISRYRVLELKLHDFLCLL